MLSAQTCYCTSEVNPMRFQLSRTFRFCWTRVGLIWPVVFELFCWWPIRLGLHRIIQRTLSEIAVAETCHILLCVFYAILVVCRCEISSVSSLQQLSFRRTPIFFVELPADVITSCAVQWFCRLSILVLCSGSFIVLTEHNPIGRILVKLNIR